MKKLDLDTFELSQNYTLFYDKLEKANYFLESILDHLGGAHQRPRHRPPADGPPQRRRPVGYVLQPH